MSGEEQSAGSASLNVRVRGLAVLLVALSLVFALPLTGVSDLTARALALVVVAVGFWAFAILPEALTGLLFLLGAVTFGELASATVFSGFTTTAFWLIFAGVVLSASATKTELSHWLAGRLLSGYVQTASYRTRVSAIVVFSASLALILPSTLARIAILVPIVIALCARLGYPAGSRGRTGLVLAAAIGTYIVPITFLPANLPNIVLAGSLESLYGITLNFGSYTLLHFPVIGLIKGLALVAILTKLYREDPILSDCDALESCKPLAAPARRLMIVLALTLMLWSTDVLHGYSPAWVGLAAALVCLMPMSRILKLSDMPFNSAFPMLLYLGAVLGIGSVMTESGAGVALSGSIVDRLPLAQASDLSRLVMLGLTAAATAVLTTMPAAPAIIAPLFEDIAATTGWSVEAVGMSQVLGYATPLMPYQLPPLMMAISMTGIAMREATRVLILLAVLTSPVVFLASHFWWGALGWY